MERIKEAIKDTLDINLKLARIDLKHHILSNKPKKVMKAYMDVHPRKPYAIIDDKGSYSKMKWTPLGFAIIEGKMAIVKMLLENFMDDNLLRQGSKIYGVNVEKPSQTIYEFKSPLFIAIQNYRDEIAELLFEKGARCTADEMEHLDSLAKRYSTFLAGVQEKQKKAAEKEKEERKSAVFVSSEPPARVSQDDSSVAPKVTSTLRTNLPPPKSGQWRNSSLQKFNTMRPQQQHLGNNKRPLSVDHIPREEGFSANSSGHSAPLPCHQEADKRFSERQSSMPSTRQPQLEAPAWQSKRLQAWHRQEAQDIQITLESSKPVKEPSEDSLVCQNAFKTPKAEELAKLQQKNAKLKEKLKEDKLNSTIRERKWKEKIAKLEAENKKLKKVEEILLLTRLVKDLRLDDFNLSPKVLGKGSNSIVFLAETTLSNGKKRKFAMKMILNIHQLQTNALSEEYKNEHHSFYIHPNIIHMLSEFTARPNEQMLRNADASLRPYLVRYNAQTEEETPITTQFFLAEYHPTTLEEVFKTRKFSMEQVYKYSRELLDCFSFLFDHHIVHRDAKMANILVSFDDHLILNDFGESVMTDSNHCCAQWELKAGNMQYQAPEILNAWITKANSLHFAGQYSWEVGCLIFEMIAGEFPFPGYPATCGKAPNIRVGKVSWSHAFDSYEKDFVDLIAALLENDAGKRMRIKEALEKFDEMEWRKDVE